MPRWFSPTLRAILKALIELEEASFAELEQRLWGWDASGGPDDTKRVIRVQVCNLRHLVEPRGVSIQTLPGLGYRLAPEARAQARVVYDDLVRETSDRLRKSKLKLNGGHRASRPQEKRMCKVSYA